MDRAFIDRLHHAHSACPSCPSTDEVGRFFDFQLELLFPDFGKCRPSSPEELVSFFSKQREHLEQMLGFTEGTTDPARIAGEFFDALPSLHQALHEDVTAMYEGDPAAKSRREVVRTYPGFYAIAAYRIANKLHSLGVPDLPRVITERAHSKTGVDIHPGARIGRHFCIDHGTGIVIGETAVIGDRVKLYQGVTIGALSVNKEDASKKRHPTIEDNVVVYAGATILGGDTVIGRDSVIGGNVWLTRSVPAGSRIYYQSKMYNGETGETDVVVFRT